MAWGNIEQRLTSKFEQYNAPKSAEHGLIPTVYLGTLVAVVAGLWPSTAMPCHSQGKLNSHEWVEKSWNNLGMILNRRDESPSLLRSA